MKKFVMLFQMLFFGMIHFAVAQSTQISGIITRANSQDPIAGVSVTEKGTNTGTLTDENGAFTLTVSQPNAVLVVSSVGFETQEMPLNGNTQVNISLSGSSEALTEVIVTGYGERLRRSFTGSAVLVGSEKLANKPFTSVDQALQGNVAGLQLSAASGTPGSFQNIRIRGISSITAGNEPLFVIDGVPVVSGSSPVTFSYSQVSILSSLNSNDIDNITVLKDASATALYGARGANGVIVITTKSGKSGKPIVSVSANTGIVRKASDGPKMLDAFQYAELYYESRVNAGQATSIDQAKALFPLNWDGVTNTDWQDVITNDDAKTAGADVSVRGGAANSKYFASLGYLEQDGGNVGVNFNRISGKLNYETDITDKLKFMTSSLGSFVNQNGQYEEASWFGSPEAGSVYIKPIDPIYNAEGSYNLNLQSSYYHPLWVAEFVVHENKQTRLFNATSLGYNITKNLKFTSSIGLDYLHTEQLDFDPPGYGDGAFVDGLSYQYSTRNFNYDWKNMLDYNWLINDNHSTSFKVVYEAQKNKNSYVAFGGYGIAAEGLIYPSSVSTVDYWDGLRSDWAINSILGLVSYNFKDKLYLDGTIRREGNSRFSPDNRWGTFYSVGASYDLMQEDFMSTTSNWLNAAKIRASYGKTGNANIGLNQYQVFLGYGGNYNGISAINPSQLGNENLTWENNYTWNIGFDYGFFNRINGSVEYFHRNTTDLLLSVPLTQTSGFSSQTQNIGEMVNNGIEASLNADILKNAFKWNLGINLTKVKNEVTKLPRSTDGEEIGITTAFKRVTEGEPVDAWFFATWAGVDPANGAPLWFKEGKAGETTSVFAQAARSIHGNASPTLYGGINNNFEYKGIYLNSSFYYATGHNIFDRFALHLRSDGRFNYTLSSGYANLLNRWQKPGDIAENPINKFNNSSNSHQLSSRNIYKGDFIRLRDLTLGYRIPASLLSKVKISTASIYVRGNNLWTWTKEDLPYDPETRADGLLTLVAQPLKTIIVGLNVNF